MTAQEFGHQGWGAAMGGGPDILESNTCHTFKSAKANYCKNKHASEMHSCVKEDGKSVKFKHTRFSGIIKSESIGTPGHNAGNK